MNGLVIPSGEYNLVLTGPNGVVAADASGINFTSLMAGAYTLQAEHAIRRCRSAVVNINVGLQTLLPTVNLTRVNNGSCNPDVPNGSITASASTIADGPGTVYTYQWFNGGLPITSSPLPATGPTLTGLAMGQYSVRATNTTTGCYRDVTIGIINQPILPAATFSTNPETYCYPNGTIVIEGITENANIVSPLSDYAITLTYPDGTTSIQGGDIPFTGLAGGRYYIEIQHSIRLCKSLKQEVNVEKAIVLPVVASEITAQTSCEPGSPNGSIVATADGLTGAPYVFEWFNGNLPIPAGAPIKHTGNQLGGLTPGSYSLRLTNTTTGCIVFNSYTVGENKIIPIVSTTTDELTDCVNPDGAIIATLQAGLDPADYYFHLHYGTEIKTIADLTVSPLPGATEAAFINLPIGNYRVVAEQKINKCRSSDLNNIFVAEDDDTKINSTQESFPASCDSDGGALEAKAFSTKNSQSSGGQGYDFTWYTGTISNLGYELIEPDAIHPNLQITSTPFESRVQGLIQGYYTVKVYNIETGCEAWNTEFLPYQEAHKVLLTATHATSCVDFSNTQITARIDPNAPDIGRNFPAENYIFRLYEGDYASGTPLETVDGDNFTAGSYTFTGYAPGNYSIIATNKAPPFCPSEPETITIGTDTRDPEITLIDLEPNTQCGPFNGVINISVAPAAGDNPASAYTFEWKDVDGNDVTDLFSNLPLSTASNVLPPGTYTVTIFNNVTQCSFETSYIIGNNPPVVSLNLVQNDQTTCNPNGTISILEILENNQPVALSGYNYILYDDSYSLLAESADKLNFDSNFTFEDLPAGNYIVQAIHKTTGCSIPSATTIIDDAILYPVLTLVSLPNPDESCPGGNPTGAIAALADGFDDNNLDYVFK